ncbi:NADH-FMN oxidoreductase RutF, flavin reductase (DIM6/NTAB) family [Bosea sp. OK403]|uniref:flavin reductase family protein n=1 Tax=Bosea sp. OK403 TaxID=1855286 RepID=UPI0008ECEFB9|nr:flavin reductase family protein [Bosea sp. OK403]SFJ38365.1 NADH-FMN oxidoreductase RutF, flavin reductase (DIM6/NTAB) family [Bosea sp. OK403]
MTELSTEPKPIEAAPQVVTFDFAKLSPRERYKLLIGAVVPRPIALVTTVDAQGVVNAAPFSFFNCLSADPAILALGVEYRPTGGQKDTGRNVRETLAFTVNIVSDALVEGMNICAVPFESGTDELAQAGLTAMPGVKVPCPWIGQAPAAFECRHHTTLGIGNSREIILGEVVYAHFRADTINAEKLYVDPAALDAVGRMGGHGYATTRDYFDLPTMSAATWQSDPAAANRRR